MTPFPPSSTICFACVFQCESFSNFNAVVCKRRACRNQAWWLMPRAGCRLCRCCRSWQGSRPTRVKERRTPKRLLVPSALRLLEDPADDGIPPTLASPATPYTLNPARLTCLRANSSHTCICACLHAAMKQRMQLQGRLAKQCLSALLEFARAGLRCSCH